MKNYSYRIVLLLLNTVLAGFLSASIFFYCRITLGFVEWKVVTLTFIISFVSGLLFIFFINSLILKKINKLYAQVRNFRSSVDEQPKIKSFIGGNTNEMERLNVEILAWGEDRKNEIERLKKLEVYRKEYLGNVSHELKTPIFNIQGYVLTLLDGGLEDPTINKDYLQRAERSIDRMIGIIDDLEAISQLETGELELEYEKFDIVALAKDVVDAQELNSTKRGVMLTVGDFGRPVYVFADKFRIRQVLVNLIVNSIKYGKEYGETKIKLADVGENIVIEIADNGIGIANEHLPRLFERFYRVEKSRSRDIGGTGLGLAIVKHIIEGHNQAINVMSTVGVGTVFTFTLKKA